MGGFLLAQDLKAIPNSQKFIEDLNSLNDLTDAARAYLKWRWWPTGKEKRRNNRRSAAQLYLTASRDDRNILTISDLMLERAQLSAGKKPEEKDWKQAVLGLQSLSDFPVDSFMGSFSLDKLAGLRRALSLISKAFERRDAYLSQLQEILETYQKEKLDAIFSSLTLEAFAEKVKGQGFPRKYLEELLLERGKPTTVGAVLELIDQSPYIFRGKRAIAGARLISNYRKDTETLIPSPDLEDKDDLTGSFLRLAYTIQREQASSAYPSRTRFENVEKLLDNGAEELRIVARTQKDLVDLSSFIDSLLDEKKLNFLSSERPLASEEEARRFFRDNPATYQAFLSSLGLNALTLEQLSGFLSPELTTEIRKIEVDTSFMKSALRSYQLFGVQYAIHQKRVVIGDEPGLGKTITALGLASHLKVNNHLRFLVIVPGSVLENWRREVLKHTAFNPLVIYGEQLETNWKTWSENGGFALATYESIQAVNRLSSQAKPADLVVVDEAHAIKNPKTLRSKNIIPWLGSAPYALLLTGTPLENRLEEFEQLIHYVQPNLEFPENKEALSQFRRAIAPAYLRRNQKDVLHELPSKIDERIYIELTEADQEYYKRALKLRDTHLAKRAKVLAGVKSSTVQWIQAKVREAVESGDKVLIFSYYRETIDILQRILKEDSPYQPITGSVDFKGRQAIIDAFAQDDKPRALLAQITSGGYGLNIQAANVIILVEPQVKPSLEEQAIRRSFRMGQTKQVQVYRLRGKNTLDDRWQRILNEKAKIFEATAGQSDSARLDAMGEAINKQAFEEEVQAWGLTS